MWLTTRQRAVLEYIKKHVVEKGFPPTVRETAAHFEFASPLSAQLHINALVKKGFLKKSRAKQRTIEVIGLRPAGVTRIPLLKKVGAAGTGIFNTLDTEDYISVDKGLFKTNGGFALRVKGNSMIDAGIFEGDIALINPHMKPEDGEIVFVLISDEAMIKRFYKEQSRIRLVSENGQIKPITLHARYVRIIGKVVGILKTF